MVISSATEPARFLSPPRVAKLLGVTPETVLGWIRSGELRGFNLAARTAKKPRFRVDRIDLEAFLAGRTVQSPPKACRRRTQYRPADYTEFV